MKSHPRIRKTIKWGGAAMTALLVFVWLASSWVSFSWQGRRPQSWAFVIGGGNLSWDHGVVELEWGQFPVKQENLGPAIKYTKGSVASGSGWGVGPTGGMVQVSLWAIICASALATAVAWWIDHLLRPVPVGCCPRCRYNRAGLAASAVCPECGALPAEPATHA